MLRNLFLLAVLLLQSAFVHADESKYYGYLGACDSAIYQFDFTGGDFTIFGAYKFTVGNVPQYQYFSSRGKLAKLSDNKYMMEPGNGQPPAVINLDKNGSIRGKTKDNASFYFDLCEPKKALAFIQDVKNHTK